MSATDLLKDSSVAVAFPLPFQILALIGLQILGWATNLHGLDAAGIDVISSLDLRTDISNPLPAHHPTPRQSSALVALYRSVYRIFVAYSCLCFASWLAWEYTTKGDVRRVDTFGYIPGIASLSIVCILLCPYNILHKTERRKLLQYFEMDTTNSHEVRKVHKTPMDPADALTSFPYLVRLRQCVIEYNHQGNTHRRPLYNALKYASAFPSIYLSAANRMVVDVGDENSGWFGGNYIFRLWLLAALVNSLYSFWWDMTNDWGMELLKVLTAEERKERDTRSPLKRLFLPRMHSFTPLVSRRTSVDAHGSVVDSRSTAEILNQRKHYHPFGLRHSLHFPLLVYPFLIFLNLVLRLIWSLKLFSVVNVKSHASIANFFLKMAELFRRWVWVFIRIEWEMIKKGRESQPKNRANDDAADYEMIPSAIPDRI
ncbi:hypothetical protein H0H81_003206 [Sphagnurus paluster]|uniref:EXS domain-containing protein n=1 Tax=Sphagnurus paluster TaxID=117069 RepID=A0A9P7GWM4_9AGAR|nr:hypothetical protein H0H81_003206 [Sphagnurus paluster]